MTKKKKTLLWLDFSHFALITEAQIKLKKRYEETEGGRYSINERERKNT